MRRWLHGLDELVVETLYIGVSALVAIVILSYLVNTGPAHALDGVPIVGRGVAGVRSLVGQVAGPPAE